MRCRHCINKGVKLGHDSYCAFHFNEIRERWAKEEETLKKEAPEAFNALSANIRRKICHT